MTRIIYYSATERAFLFSDVHGPKTFGGEGEDVIPNPRYPDDAVEVSAEDYERLMAAQGFPEGKMIEPDESGYPVAVDAPEERLAMNWRAWRDGELAATAWTQEGDVPEATKEKWRPYRQALRNIPQQEGFPRNVTKPERPV